MTVSDFAWCDGNYNLVQSVPGEPDEICRVLTEHANDYIHLHDLDGRCVYASQSVERHYGHTPTGMFDFVQRRLTFISPAPTGLFFNARRMLVRKLHFAVMRRFSSRKMNRP